MRPTHLVSLLFLLVFALSACKPESTEDKAAPAVEKTVAKAEPAQKKSDGLFGGMFSSEPEPVKLDLGEFKLLEVNLGTSVDSDNLVTKPKVLFGYQR